jgi:hypothetical protein
MGWTTSGGRPRLDPVLVSFHHPVNPLLDDAVFRRMIQAQKSIATTAWGAAPLSKGFFPAEMCFSERMIPALVAEGLEWCIVPDIHIARACADYPYQANLDNCDPPNRADQINPAQGAYTSHTISRGVTTRVPVPYGLRPHQAQHVDPASGQVSKLVVVPAANGMSWNEGYGLYGTGEIDAIAALNDPTKPMLVLFAHDGDNAWAGGHTYYHQNVSSFSNAAAAQGYEPTTIGEFLADHPVDPADVVHVEDGGWVNADGDFGSPQFINWNWPLLNAAGQFDIPNGWAEDERNWAVLTAATNVVLTAEGVAGPPNVARIVDPTLPGTTELEKAWHFLLVGFESGYMYYGKSLDFEIKPTLAANRAIEHAVLAIGAAPDTTAPTVWLPQRFPWNPGGKGGGSLWGYPGGAGATMSQDFWVWTFVHDVSGVDTARFVYRLDADGTNPLASIQNETFAGGPEVGTWQALAMTRRPFPTGDVYDDPEIDFSVLPVAMSEQWSVHLSGLDSVLVDYYVEATDRTGRVRRSPIQHVWVGAGGSMPPANPAVSWEPAAPEAGGTLTIHYDPVPGALPDATNPVFVHVGHSGWSGVLNPDPAMTWNAGTQRFDYVYAIPSNATSVDFVFRSGSNQWDNHGGADWHGPVSGASAPPWVMDGTADAGAPVVASCEGLELRAAFDGRWLYFAVPNVAATAGLDHFVFVSHADSSAPGAAPWAKAGQSPQRRLLLGNEDSNGWNGWSNGAGGGVSAGVANASGSVLEGRVDVNAWWTTPPTALRVAFGAYGSPDGGTLQRQIPCGDGDGNLESAEMVLLESSTVSVSGPPGTRVSDLNLAVTNPTRGEIVARVEGAGAGAPEVALYDLRGARVMRLAVRGGGGSYEARASVARLAAGVYFAEARTPGARVTRRVVVLP